jgi:hypothetical protein
MPASPKTFLAPKAALRGGGWKERTLSVSTSTEAGGPADPAATQKLVANERIKITATLLNNCAVATLGSGVIVPSAALAYGTSIPRSPYYLLVAAGWFVSGVVIHLFTRWTLRGLKA